MMFKDVETFSEERKVFIHYAQLISQRGYVCNQLGNIAIRSAISLDESLIITKHRGPSLEEMTDKHIIGVGLHSDNLYFGLTPPSIGHSLNKEIFIHRDDINAVIHVHVDELIAYFSMYFDEQFQYLSADAAIIIGTPIQILPPEINVEADALLAKQYVQESNVLILANHGVTTFGRTLSEAYHRLNTMVAEVRRVILARQLSLTSESEVKYISQQEENHLYSLAKEIL